MKTVKIECPSCQQPIEINAPSRGLLSPVIASLVIGGLCSAIIIGWVEWRSAPIARAAARAALPPAPGPAHVATPGPNALQPGQTTVPSSDGRISEPGVGVDSVAPPGPAPIEKIEGAFGKRLGEVFNPADAIATSALTDGTTLYEFSTPNGFRSFKRYYVMITPTTHKIYSIWGVGSVENTQAGQKEQAVIMELLKKKYGAEEKQQPFDALGEAKNVAQGNRFIITKISGFTDVTLDIRYYDGDLAELAEKERLASEVQNAGKSGL